MKETEKVSEDKISSQAKLKKETLSRSTYLLNSIKISVQLMNMISTIKRSSKTNHQPTSKSTKFPKTETSSSSKGANR